jgi:hypothetical protein
MKVNRAPAAGESRTCPHCKATILKSSATCPLCHHSLRFVSIGTEPRPRPAACPLLIEGTLKHPGDGEALEYSVLVEVRSESGKLLSRQIIGVGAVGQAEQRIFSLRVEVSPAGLPH